VRGIARRKIFFDDLDRDKFLERFGSILKDSDTACFAWALIPNHLHLLLKTGLVPLSTVMRRLLTGYAITFNLRHRRSGHLFQNRYKSILCQEDSYLLELTRYIHLNPLRAKLVSSLQELDYYPYAGHSVLMGLQENKWQDVNYVLRHFGRFKAQAKTEYKKYVQKGIAFGRRPELTGGGFVRSSGGWAEVKALKKAKIYMKGDERILGDSDFVQRSLQQANEHMEEKYKIQSMGFTIDKIADRVAESMGIPLEQVFAAGKNRQTVQARSVLCFWAIRKCGLKMVSLSNRLRISQAAVSLSVKRGERIAADNRFELMPRNFKT
jgi:REP element-mobilizing transposase RayT